MHFDSQPDGIAHRNFLRMQSGFQNEYNYWHPFMEVGIYTIKEGIYHHFYHIRKTFNNRICM